MENIDLKFEEFKILVNEISNYQDSIHSEDDTRLKVINRILIEILDWPFKDIQTNDSTGKGLIDYNPNP